MNIEQFELILCDMYTMDAWSPPLLWKWKKEFKEASTKQWAIRELENYIRKRLHHRSDGSVDEFIRFTNEFAMKMAIQITQERTKRCTRSFKLPVRSLLIF
jgi:carboxypeptidase C (cathepsin A)